MGSNQERKAFAVTIRPSHMDPSKAEPVIIAIAEVFGARLKTDPSRAFEIMARPSERVGAQVRAEFNLDSQLLRRVEEDGLSQEEARAKVLEIVGDAPVIAHGLEFVKAVAPWLVEGRLAIDSLRLAKHAWPKGTLAGEFALETHKAHEIKYWLGLDPDTMASEPTGAFAEAIIVGAVFSEAAKLCPEKTFEALASKAEKPAPLLAYPYGRKAGTPFSELGLDFIESELGPLRDKPLDIDLRHALESELDRRREDIKAEASKRSAFARRPGASLFG